MAVVKRLAVVARPSSMVEEMVPASRDTLGTVQEKVRGSHRKGSGSVTCTLDADWENALCTVGEDSGNVICIALGLVNVLCTAAEDSQSELCSDRLDSAMLLENDSALVTWLLGCCGNSVDA